MSPAIYSSPARVAFDQDAKAAEVRASVRAREYRGRNGEVCLGSIAWAYQSACTYREVCDRHPEFKGRGIVGDPKLTKCQKWLCLSSEELSKAAS